LRKTRRVAEVRNDAPSGGRCGSQLEERARDGQRCASDVERDLPGREPDHSVPGATPYRAFHSGLQAGPLRSRHSPTSGAEQSKAGTPAPRCQPEKSRIEVRAGIFERVLQRDRYMPEAFPRGRFIWHELMTTDPDSAVPFYKKVVGWNVQSWEPDPTYRLWTMGDSPMGGLMPLPEHAQRMGTPPYWLPYVAVPDVDATVRQATSLGARTYVEPRDIPVGRFAVLADPQGATFALYKPAVGQPPTSDDAGLADFSWHELATTNWRAAWD